MSANNEKIEALLEPTVSDLGYELVDVELIKENQKWFLRVYIDKEDGIGLDDCELVSNQLDNILDEYDPISQSYILEVSSPGAERPLKKKKDYIHFVGRKIQVKTYMQINGQKKFVGKLLGLEDDEVLLESEDGEQINIPLEKIAKANLVLEI